MNADPDKDSPTQVSVRQCFTRNSLVHLYQGVLCNILITKQMTGAQCAYPRTSSTGQWSEPKISSWMDVERMRGRRASETTK